MDQFSVQRFMVGRTKTIHKTVDPVWVEHTKQDAAQGATAAAGKQAVRARKSSVFAQEAGSTISPGATATSAAPTRRKIIEESMAYSLKKQLRRMQNDAVLVGVVMDSPYIG
jgi:hypothetical protein